MRGPLLHPTMKMRPVEAGMRPATAVLSCGARDGVSLGCSRPCALACLGMRRATAAGGPQRYRRRRNSIGAGRCSAAPSGLPRVPPISGAPRAPHALPPRRAADRCALLRGFGLGRSAIVAARRGRLARLALPGRTLRGPARSAARRPFVAASAPGGRGSSLRSSPGVRSRAAPCSLPSPALRGPGSLPGPLPLFSSFNYCTSPLAYYF